MADALARRDMASVIRIFRQRTGCSQSHVGALVDMPQSRISDLELGKNQVIALEVFVRIADGLGIPRPRLGLADAVKADTSERLSSGDDERLRPDPGSRVAHSQQHFRAIRQLLNNRRVQLSKAAALRYPPEVRLADTGLLAAAGWIPKVPNDLDEIELAWEVTAAPPAITGHEAASSHVRPLREPGRRYMRYSHAVREVDRPALYENRMGFRLLDVSQNRWTFGPTSYFDWIDVGEALAHETAIRWQDVGDPQGFVRLKRRQLPFRTLAGDPFKLQRRAVLPSINTLTIRDGADPSFVLHQRDPDCVAIAGGTYHVIPAGVFQPSSVLPPAQSADFDLWRSIMREYSEEFLDSPEHDGTGSPVVYDSEEPFRSLAQARKEGQIRVLLLGIGMDALTLAAEILTVAVFDDFVYDAILGNMVEHNSEGRIITSYGNASSSQGIPFTGSVVSLLLSSGLLAPAAAECLHLAWRHRDTIID